MAEMKGIKLCGECGNYDYKKHRCRIGCNDDSNAQASFYGDCPLPDVVPKSNEGAECPTCHGTGRIGTTDWLTKNISKEQLAKEKAEAIAEHELHIKQDYAREIFEEIEKRAFGFGACFVEMTRTTFDEIKKKYTEGDK